MIHQLTAEREKLVKALEAHKPDPALAARIAELKAELAKLTAKATGADIKAQIASYDRAIYALEHPTASGTGKPMSEADARRRRAHDCCVLARFPPREWTYLTSNFTGDRVAPRSTVCRSLKLPVESCARGSSLPPEYSGSPGK